MFVELKVRVLAVASDRQWPVSLAVLGLRVSLQMSSCSQGSTKLIVLMTALLL